MRQFVLPIAAALVALAATPALAHVSVQPSEAVAGSFSRFVIRVPNESDKDSTVKVKVNFPPMAFVSFQPKSGWTRDVQNVTFDEPVDAFGNKITEGVGSVTWSGGKIGPGEFDEFGFSAAMPEGEDSLEFSAIQTYSSGEVVKWSDAADAEEEMTPLKVYDLGLGEDEGQLGLLASLNRHMNEMMGAPGESGAPSDDGGDSSTIALIVAVFALVVAIVALIVGRRPKA